MLLPINPDVVRTDPDLLNNETFSPFDVEPEEFRNALTAINYDISIIHPIWVHKKSCKGIGSYRPMLEVGDTGFEPVSWRPKRQMISRLH